MSDLEELTNRSLKFRDDRDWKQFHSAKNLAIDLAVEAAEVLELFTWKSKEEIEEFLKTNQEKLAEELCDVLHTILLLAHDNQIDLKQAYHRKMDKNEAKYPVTKARGKHSKYTEL